MAWRKWPDQYNSVTVIIVADMISKLIDIVLLIALERGFVLRSYDLDK